MRTDDPIDIAFDLLRARSSKRVSLDLDLEKRMMKELEKGKRKMPHWKKMAGAISLCAVLTAGAAATGGVGEIMDWVSLTGYFDMPDGSSGYVEDGVIVSGEIGYDGTFYQIVDGNMLDEDGGVIGTVEMVTTQDEESPEE